MKLFAISTFLASLLLPAAPVVADTEESDIFEGTYFAVYDVVYPDYDYYDFSGGASNKVCYKIWLNHENPEHFTATVTAKEGAYGEVVDLGWNPEAEDYKYICADYINPDPMDDVEFCVDVVLYFAHTGDPLWTSTYCFHIKQEAWGTYKAVADAGTGFETGSTYDYAHKKIENDGVEGTLSIANGPVKYGKEVVVQLEGENYFWIITDLKGKIPYYDDDGYPVYDDDGNLVLVEGEPLEIAPFYEHATQPYFAYLWVPLPYFKIGKIYLHVEAEWHQIDPSRRDLQEGGGNLSEELEITLDTSDISPELLGSAGSAPVAVTSIVGTCLAAAGAAAIAM